MLKVVIITVLAVQLVNTVAALIIDSEEKFAYVACGVPAAILYVIISVIRKVMKAYRKANYKALLRDSDGKLCYCNSSDEPEELVNNGYTWADDLREIYTFKDGWKKEDSAFGDTINIRYSPIKKVKELGAYEVKTGK